MSSIPAPSRFSPSIRSRSAPAIRPQSPRCRPRVVSPSPERVASIPPITRGRARTLTRPPLCVPTPVHPPYPEPEKLEELKTLPPPVSKRVHFSKWAKVAIAMAAMVLVLFSYVSLAFATNGRLIELYHISKASQIGCGLGFTALFVSAVGLVFAVAQPPQD